MAGEIADAIEQEIRKAFREALMLLDELNSMAAEERLTDAQKAANHERMEKWDALLRQ